MLRGGNHVGRVGSYTDKSARQGVAPFGGIDRKLGTSPISIASPWDDGALVLDMTSSATAKGKVRIAFQKGEPVPEGWLIDADGNPTTDPGSYYADPPGAILPLGGPLGHKGYGLGVMIDVFAGVLSGSGVCRTDLPRGSNGVWLYLVDVEQLLPRDEYDGWIARYAAHVKSSRRLQGGWIAVVLLGLVMVLIWGTVDPVPTHEIFKLSLSNFVGKTVFVTGLLVAMFACGSLQLACCCRFDDKSGDADTATEPY